MQYKIIKGSRGIRYMKGSKLCKKTDIPADILVRLLKQEEVDTSKDCVVCGKPGTEEKTLNFHRYYLCLEDYNTRTTGEIARTIAQTAS